SVFERRYGAAADCKVSFAPALLFGRGPSLLITSPRWSGEAKRSLFMRSKYWIAFGVTAVLVAGLTVACGGTTGGRGAGGPGGSGTASSGSGSGTATSSSKSATSSSAAGGMDGGGG